MVGIYAKRRMRMDHARRLPYLPYTLSIVMPFREQCDLDRTTTMKRGFLQRGDSEMQMTRDSHKTDSKGIWK